MIGLNPSSATEEAGDPSVWKITMALDNLKRSPPTISLECLHIKSKVVIINQYPGTLPGKFKTDGSEQENER
jgi:hypothetical protein